MEPKLSKEEFGKRLKETMTRKNITQKKLSELADTSEANISNYARGKAFPPVDILAKIASVLDVSLDWLCGIEDQISYANDTYTTVGDVAKDIIKLCKSELVSLREMFYEENIYTIDSMGCPEQETVTYKSNALLIFDSKLGDFVSEWMKVKQVCKDVEMGDTLYEPWLKSRLDSLDHIAITDAFPELPF